jgi:succinyl-diaminopimelate desuccinylase
VTARGASTFPDPVALAARLIACPSVTPAEAGVFDAAEVMLAPLGFAVHRFTAGAPPHGPVENLVAIRGTGAPHFAFAGHLDVVPPGAGWASDPFEPSLRGGLLHGRGAVDMKGAVAAMVAAAARVPDHRGTLYFLLTLDEEGPAVHGTRAIIDWLAAHGLHPDLCLVGEPTSSARLGDTIKNGRRGSVNVTITVPGTQGHVAYPHLADNPITKLVAALAALDTLALDEGTPWFQPSNLEITDIAVGNPASNVIPGHASARLNIRFNDRHSGEALVDRVRAVVADHAPGATVEALVSGEAFVTEPGPLTAAVTRAVEAVTGLTPALSTSGGTSDARFLSRLCPVVEFGLVNATMHKLDEAVAVADLHALTEIYGRLLADVLG